MRLLAALAGLMLLGVGLLAGGCSLYGVVAIPGFLSDYSFAPLSVPLMLVIWLMGVGLAFACIRAALNLFAWSPPRPDRPRPFAMTGALPWTC